VMSREGYIYLLRAAKPFDECYKIGRTADPKRRLTDFGVKLPYSVTPLMVTKVEDMFEEEAWLHRQFASVRVDGEWFKLSDRDVAAIRAYYLIMEADLLFGRLINRLHARWNEGLDTGLTTMTADRYITRNVRLARILGKVGARVTRRHKTWLRVRV
jgi:hypothetical protein